MKVLQLHQVAVQPFAVRTAVSIAVLQVFIINNTALYGIY